LRLRSLAITIERLLHRPHVHLRRDPERQRAEHPDPQDPAKNRDLVHGVRHPVHASCSPAAADDEIRRSRRLAISEIRTPYAPFTITSTGSSTPRSNSIIDPELSPAISRSAIFVLPKRSMIGSSISISMSRFDVSCCGVSARATTRLTLSPPANSTRYISRQFAAAGG